MQFEVNGQKYFLNFVDDEGQWYLLTPTDKGLENIAIENDDGPLLPVMLPMMEKNETIN